ncbi:hypothetical protein [Novosphingobium malaysiense]|uniref:hypothetical protein n=1 Tax=Novosphingobium malaysiense TaxID=1348853 RepID=UPI0012E01E0C|nr:hypothetical protein [Novosphingobium malaysiense]
MAERDRRISLAVEVTGLWRRAEYFKKGSEEKAIAFVADVWAAQTLLRQQLGGTGASPTRIAKWLAANGRDHGYTLGSLRTKIYQARRRIVLLETTEVPWKPGVMYWPPFDF